MNLICCTSPLQVLIAERIIDLYPDEEFFGVFSVFFSSPKIVHYFERLKKKSKRAELIVSNPQNKLETLHLTVKLLSQPFFLSPFKRVFLSSLDNSNFNLLIHRSPEAEIITFDDGAINVTPSAFRLIWRESVSSGKLFDILHKFFDIPTADELFQRQSKHYTIYPYPNVMPHAQLISLDYGQESEPDKEERQKDLRQITILMGQPIYDTEDREEEHYHALIAEIRKRYQPMYYIPHPRETFPIEGIEYIDTPLIFEDYILGELKAHPEQEYIVYSYCSSSILNLQNIPRLRFIALRPSDCPPHLLDTYKLYESLEVDIHDIELPPLTH